MKEELQSKLVEILSQLQAAIAAGADFTLAQMPDVVRQFLIYHQIAAVFWVVVYLSLFIGSIIWMVQVMKLYKRKVAARVEYYERKNGNTSRADADYIPEPSLSDYAVVAYFPGVSLMVVSFVSLIYNIPHLFLVFFAPKVFLIQKIAELLK